MSFAQGVAIMVVGSAVCGGVLHVRLAALQREGGDLGSDSLPSTSALLQIEGLVFVPVLALVCVQLARGADANIVGPLGILAFATSLASALTWKYVAIAQSFYGPTQSGRSRILSTALAAAFVLVLLAIR